MKAGIVANNSLITDPGVRLLLMLLLRVSEAVAMLLWGGVLHPIVRRRKALAEVLIHLLGSTVTCCSGTVREREVGTGRPNLESVALSILGRQDVVANIRAWTDSCLT